MDNKKVSFVEFERRRLFALVERHRDTVLDRRTDSTSVHRKRQTWERITHEYNRHSGVRKRQTQQLKRLWQNANARAKRADGSFPNERKKTGFVEVDKGVEATSCSSNDVPDQFSEILDENTCVDPDQIQPNEELPNDEENIEQLLAPIIAARLKKLEESIRQQAELHQAHMMREQLELKGVQDEMQRQASLHAHRLDRERELADLRLTLEKDMYVQRMRHEQELHQIKLNEYNKAHQAASYQIMYKQ